MDEVENGVKKMIETLDQERVRFIKSKKSFFQLLDQCIKDGKPVPAKAFQKNRDILYLRGLCYIFDYLANLYPYPDSRSRLLVDKDAFDLIYFGTMPSYAQSAPYVERIVSV